MSYFLKASLVFALTIPFSHSFSKDFGTHGHVFALEEEDFLSYLNRKLAELPDEKVEEVENRIKLTYMERVKRPRPVPGLSIAKESRFHYFDPTVCMSQDIKDSRGNIIVAKGACINPLKRIPLNQPLIFFSGEKPDQLTWARENKDAKWILVSGSPLSLEELERRPVYFDQGGVLVKKLGIKAVPTIVTQEGAFLKVEEVPLEDK